MSYKVIANGRVLTIADGTMPSYFVGLDASKTPNPSVGDKYAAFDTGKEYTCFVSNVWSLVSSPCYEEYSNHLGAFDNMMDSLIFGSVVSDHVNHRFDLTLISPVNTPSLGWNRTLSIAETFELNFKVDNIAGGSFDPGAVDTDILYTGIGIMAGDISIVVQQETHSVIEGGVHAWEFVTSDNVNTETTVLPTIVNGDLITFKNYGTIIMLYINGILKATHSTVVFSGSTGLPIILCNGEGSGRTISLDAINWRIYK